jgi:hypothetical protein
MTKRKVGELILDFNVYPRMSVDTQHISYMREALEAGGKFPPLVICAKTLRIVDGFHRHKLYLMAYGSDYEADVIEKSYKRDADLFADAMRLNAEHGRSLSRYDRAHCLLVAEKLTLSLDETAVALGMTVDKLTELRVNRVATLSVSGKGKGAAIPLKRTIAHMTGKTLTPAQAEVNDRLGGMNQLFYVNQLISLLEADLIDRQNADLMKRLQVLRTLIGKVKVAA